MRDLAGCADAPDQGPTQQGRSLHVEGAGSRWAEEQLQGMLRGGHQMGGGDGSSCCDWRALQPGRAPGDSLQPGQAPGDSQRHAGNACEGAVQERQWGTSSACSPKCRSSEREGRFHQGGGMEPPRSARNCGVTGVAFKGGSCEGHAHEDAQTEDEVDGFEGRGKGQWPPSHAWTAVSQCYDYRTLTFQFRDPRLPEMLRPIIQVCPPLRQTRQDFHITFLAAD